MDIRNIGGNMIAHLKTKAMTAVIAGTMAVATFGANAQLDPQQPEGGATPISLDAIAFPLDLTSIVAVIAAAGATMIALVAGVKIAFRLTNKLINRAGNSV